MNAQQILDGRDLFLMLSRLAVNPHSRTARLRQQTNQATADLLKATFQFESLLLEFAHDYDLFCENLATLGGFTQPHTVEGISADWILPYQLINNDLGHFVFLYALLKMMPTNTKVNLPLTQGLIDLFENDKN